MVQMQANKIEDKMYFIVLIIYAIDVLAILLTRYSGEVITT